MHLKKHALHVIITTTSFFLLLTPALTLVHSNNKIKISTPSWKYI